MSGIDIKAMKAEVKANAKANKQPKTIKVKTLVIFAVTILTSAIIGGYITLLSTDAINSHIDNQVQSKVAEQVQSLKSEK